MHELSSLHHNYLKVDFPKRVILYMGGCQGFTVLRFSAIFRPVFRFWANFCAVFRFLNFLRFAVFAEISGGFSVFNTLRFTVFG